MKKTFFTLAILVASLFADTQWIDIDDVYEVAKKENKTVMVMLSRRGCPGCEYMTDVVFVDDKVSNTLEKSFIAAHIDVNEDFIPSGLEYFATPTFYFLDENEHVLKRINGPQKSKEFLKTLKELSGK